MMISVRYVSCLLLIIVFGPLCGQTDERDKISVQSSPVGGNVYFLFCVNGFGGGNVAASVGKDGILLVDNMYAWMAPKLEKTLQALSEKPVCLVANTHFHRDHIDANSVFRKSAIIIAHENVPRQLERNAKQPGANDELMPIILFADRMTINFNEEEIQLLHFSNSHTDSDVMVYFTKSKVIHLGDMFFFGMFPAVYTQGGGDIRNLVVSLESVLKTIPPDVKVIPGHGDLATMRDLENYVKMLKETIRLIEEGIREGKTLDQMRAANLLAAYNDLGNGGAQTTDQYLGMLYGLLSPVKK